MEIWWVRAPGFVVTQSVIDVWKSMLHDLLQLPSRRQKNESYSYYCETDHRKK
jgi:hypothetical protein